MLSRHTLLSTRGKKLRGIGSGESGVRFCESNVNSLVKGTRQDLLVSFFVIVRFCKSVVNMLFIVSIVVV
jgi:hypothetical protein